MPNWYKFTRKKQKVCSTTQCHVDAVKLDFISSYNRATRQLKKFLFLVMAAILNGGWDCQTRTLFLKGTTPAKFFLL